ncbi:helix-turn-helix transcriptional regulator [Sphingomonas sp. GM_Shp_2]|uniref:helix-turn-helix domain-containing protein n=1 Tax=Sphingomonas sp. GM_Shp_2 TaxID=2937380 RepID=UPI00226A1F8D|nr:helix-turn-helix transcriptional regulator [Sphingomonas sp. GM_Shp_2]
MTIGERIEERRKALGVSSQAELARRVGISQSTMNGLIKKPYRWSPHLARIARELSTSVEYLLGESNDPSETGTAATSAAAVQQIMMPVTLPGVAALTSMFEGILLASEDMRGAELARELAERLPSALAVALRSPSPPPAGRTASQPEPLVDGDGDHRAPRRASRT